MLDFAQPLSGQTDFKCVMSSKDPFLVRCRTGVASLQGVISTGARLVILSPVYDMAEQMEFLASEVVPRLTDPNA